MDDEFLQMADSAKQLSSNSELHVKAKQGDLPGIIELMEKGQNPMDRDEHGNTPLHYAARRGHLHVLKYFIDERGFNPTITGDQNRTLLHNAVMLGHLPIVQYLLHEKEVDALCHAGRKSTPLLDACLLGYGDIVKELVESLSVYYSGQDCNPLCANIDNITPLHVAAGLWTIINCQISYFRQKMLPHLQKQGWQHAPPFSSCCWPA